MPTLEQNKKALKNLITKINNKTGKNDTNMTASVNRLIDYPFPIEIDTEEKMTSILAAATLDSVGAIYKYTGESTNIYEQGSLYTVTDNLVEEDKEYQEGYNVGYQEGYQEGYAAAIYSLPNAEDYTF